MSGLSLVHLTALVAGISIILLIRRRYRGISTIELAIIIVLYVLLVILFTEPIVNTIKSTLT
jgi:hypothetical protein